MHYVSKFMILLSDFMILTYDLQLNKSLRTEEKAKYFS